MTSSSPGPSGLLPEPPPLPSTPPPPCNTNESNNGNNDSKQNNNNSFQKNTNEKAAQLRVNQAQGKAAEKAMVETLKSEGKEVFGEQVGVRTSQGLRKVDTLTQDAAGKLENVEVKSGDAVRSATQAAKDSEIATQGGTYVGKNAPDSLRGKTVKVPTVVRKPADTN